MARRLAHLLARRIREEAAAKNVALSHLADRAGLARSHFWRILNVETAVGLDTIERIADELDVDPLVLLQEQEPTKDQ